MLMNGTNGNEPGYPENALVPYPVIVAATKDVYKRQHGTYALIDKRENRDREIRKPRPSIRAQLKTDKAKTAPKRCV